MEIIITIVVFWLILAVAYAVYYVHHERTRRSTSGFNLRPESDVQHLAAEAFASGPFEMPSRPTSISSAVPEFVSRARTAGRPAVSLAARKEPEATESSPDQEEVTDPDGAAKIEVLRYVSQSDSSPRTRGNVRPRRAHVAKKASSQKETAVEELGSEVEVLRAQVQQLRSDVEGLLEARAEAAEAPRPRRTRAAGSSTSTSSRSQRRQAN